MYGKKFMKFYQYWILLIAFILVVITIKNIIKTLFKITKKESYIDNATAVKLRNLYSSVGLVSIILLVIIYLIICEN